MIPAIGPPISLPALTIAITMALVSLIEVLFRVIVLNWLTHIRDAITTFLDLA